MSTKFTCRFCKEQFDVPKGLYKHLQTAHNAGVSRDNRTCPICGVLCSKYEGYRDHLLYIHGQTDDGQKLTFKTLNEFLVWKTELEIKHNCKYILQTSPKVLPSKEKKYFYQCDRSDSKSKDKKSSVVMKTCSSVISVVESTGALKVEYWDTHSNHTKVPPAALSQSELEAAISSVEIENAMDESDDSFDKTEDTFITEDSVLNVEKQGFVTKSNTVANINNVNNSPTASASKKTSKPMQSFGKLDRPKKKNANTSVLFSLASVACGKRISKKPANKPNDDKNAETQSSSKDELEITSENISEKSNNKCLAGISLMKKDNAKSQESVTTNKSLLGESKVKVATTLPSSILLTNKTTSSTSVLPNITTVSNNSMNSLYAANSAFANQLVIMNSVNVDQNSLSSNQNVLTTGQNILLSLGPVGQNVVSAATTPETVNSKSAKADKKAVPSGNAKIAKSEAFAKGNAPILPSTKNSSISSDNTKSTITANAPIALASGLNNAPVILSSLPVGSTFMSVNNNLIPIASPTGAFIPTSLPPNIVLTPVMPGTSLTTVESSKAAQNIQTQARFTTPSSVAITVSSIVKEPLYTSSVVKTISPVSSTSIKNSKTRIQNKFVPITIAGKISPDKNLNKSVTVTKGSFNLSPSKNVSNSVTGSTFSSPKSSARKKISHGIKSRSEITTSPMGYIGTSNAVSAVNTKVVDSQLSVTPISSTPNVTITPQLGVNKPGTLLFESLGEIYMLEPIDNDDENTTHNISKTLNRNDFKPSIRNNIETSSPWKSLSAIKSTKVIKIDRAMQTNESFSNLAAMKSKLQRKRAAPPTDDSAVMLKVKCYQLEMKYLNSQTECKRLKVELTKERLKNAELRGDKTLANIENESLTEPSKTNAAEIMKEIEDKFSDHKDVNIYTMTKTSVLRSLYEDLEELCVENGDLYKELENYRTHDKFYQSLKKKLYDEEF